MFFKGFSQSCLSLTFWINRNHGSVSKVLHLQRMDVVDLIIVPTAPCQKGEKHDGNLPHEGHSQSIYAPFPGEATWLLPCIYRETSPQITCIIVSLTQIHYLLWSDMNFFRHGYINIYRSIKKQETVVRWKI